MVFQCSIIFSPHGKMFLLQEAKCDLLEAKNVLKSNFNTSFQAQLCDIGNVSSFASQRNICSTAEENVIFNRVLDLWRG